MRVAVALRGGFGNGLLMSPMLRALEILGHEIELLYDYNDERTDLLEQISWLPGHDYMELSVQDLERRYAVVFGFQHPSSRTSDGLPPLLHWNINEAKNGVLFPHVSWTTTAEHEVEYFMRPARMLGWTGVPPLPYVPQRVPENGSENIPEHLGFAIGAAPQSEWYKKMWPWQYWRELSEKLSLPVVAYGGVCDQEQSRRLAYGISGIANDTPAVHSSLLGWHLADVAAILARRCRVLVCNDTGLMHIAAAVGTPVVALWGPTLLTKNSPYGPGRIKIVNTPAPCAPCFGQPIWDTCPGGCMALIQPEDVAREVATALKTC